MQEFEQGASFTRIDGTRKIRCVHVEIEDGRPFKGSGFTGMDGTLLGQGGGLAADGALNPLV